MQNKKILVWLVLFFVALIILLSAAFEVNETEQVIITQFGKPIGDPIIEPGIHFKIPIFQEANFFEKRFYDWQRGGNGHSRDRF